MISLGLCALAIPAACDHSSSGDGSASQMPDGCDLYVEPSDDDQTAVQEALIDAEKGQTLCLAEGKYAFKRQLSSDTDGLTIKGAGGDKTILDFSKQISGGNGILITGDDTTLQDVQVLDTPGDGVRADQVKNISFIGTKVVWTAVKSTDNGAYGLYPVLSDGVLISGSEVTGSRDAGVYVGQSSNIVVETNEVHGNVAGIEIENSTDAQVKNNHSYDNTGGVLVFNLPGLDVEDGKRTNVYDNVIENNNTDNFGEPGTIVHQVPPGIGVLILANDDTEVGTNMIRGNKSAGVGIIAYASGIFDDPMDPNFDIYAENNWVHDNTFENNATDPDLQVQAIVGTNKGYDILFSGCANPNKSDPALGNCVSDNGNATFFLADVCGQNAGMTTEDPTGNTCKKTPLPKN